MPPAAECKNNRGVMSTQRPLQQEGASGKRRTSQLRGGRGGLPRRPEPEAAGDGGPHADKAGAGTEAGGAAAGLALRGHSDLEAVSSGERLLEPGDLLMVQQGVGHMGLGATGRAGLQVPPRPAHRLVQEGPGSGCAAGRGGRAGSHRHWGNTGSGCLARATRPPRSGQGAPYMSRARSELRGLGCTHIVQAACLAGTQTSRPFLWAQSSQGQETLCSPPAGTHQQRQPPGGPGRLQPRQLCSRRCCREQRGSQPPHPAGPTPAGCPRGEAARHPPQHRPRETGQPAAGERGSGLGAGGCGQAMPIITPKAVPGPARPFSGLDEAPRAPAQDEVRGAPERGGLGATQCSAPEVPLDASSPGRTRHPLPPS